MQISNGFLQKVNVTDLGPDGHFNVPTSVTCIGSEALSFCSRLISVIIPDSVTIIAWGAFRGCCNLTSVSIPDSVTKLDFLVFSSCSNLTRIIISGAINIPSVDSTFHGFSKLPTIIVKIKDQSTTEIARFNRIKDLLPVKLQEKCCYQTQVELQELRQTGRQILEATNLLLWDGPINILYLSKITTRKTQPIHQLPTDILKIIYTYLWCFADRILPTPRVEEPVEMMLSCFRDRNLFLFVLVDYEKGRMLAATLAKNPVKEIFSIARIFELLDIGVGKIHISFAKQSFERYTNQDILGFKAAIEQKGEALVTERSHKWNTVYSPEAKLRNRLLEQAATKIQLFWSGYSSVRQKLTATAVTGEITPDRTHNSVKDQPAKRQGSPRRFTI